MSLNAQLRSACSDKGSCHRPPEELTTDHRKNRPPEEPTTETCRSENGTFHRTLFVPGVTLICVIL